MVSMETFIARWAPNGAYGDIHCLVGTIWCLPSTSHLYLPQLKYLFFCAFEITDNALNSISKLKKLNIISIKSYFGRNFSGITDTGLHYLINNCPQIKSISMDFSNETNITNKTIEQLIALATRNPRIQYKHCFPLNDRLKANNLPNNLIIDFELIEEWVELSCDG